MRLAFVTDTCAPEVNGVATVLETMRAGLIARGQDVLIIAPRYGAHDPSDPVDAGILRRASIPCPGYPQVRLSWPLDPTVSRALTEFRPDVVHAVTEGPLGYQGRRFALRTGVPLVTSFHTDFPKYAERYLGPWAVEPTTGWLRRFHSAAAIVQTPSDVIRERLRKLGITQATTWGRSVNTRAFHPGFRSETVRRELDASERVLVLHVGRLAVEKDIRTLIGTFRQAEAELGLAARFCIAGDGPAAAELKRALPFVRYLGFLDRGHIAELYASADLFVFPSPTETCGLVALEAMASGLPVIGAAAGGILESVTPGVTGELVPPGDVAGFVHQVVRLTKGRAERLTMSEAARSFALTRDWEIELDALVPMYQYVLDSPARGRTHEVLAPSTSLA